MLSGFPLRFRKGFWLQISRRTLLPGTPPAERPPASPAPRSPRGDSPLPALAPGSGSPHAPSRMPSPPRDHLPPSPLGRKAGRGSCTHPTPNLSVPAAVPALLRLSRALIVLCSRRNPSWVTLTAPRGSRHRWLSLVARCPYAPAPLGGPLGIHQGRALQGYPCGIEGPLHWERSHVAVAFMSESLVGTVTQHFRGCCTWE